MSDALSEFRHLLDIKRLESLLKSVTEITPCSLFFVDLEDNVLAQAIPPSLSGQIDEAVHQAVAVDTRPPEINGRPYREKQVPVDARGRLIGRLIGLSLDPNPEATQNLITATDLVGRILNEQADKEYELNSLSAELLSRYEEITLLYELGQALGSVFDIATICDIALEMSVQVIQAENAHISLIDDNGEYLKVVATHGNKGFVGWQVPVGRGISGYVAATGQHILLNPQESAAAKKAKKLPADSSYKSEPPEAILAVPLILPADQSQANQGVLGVMTLSGRPTGKMFTAGDAKLLTSIATQVSTAIHNSRLVHALRQAERMQQQVKIAADIQQSLLPKQPPHVPGIELFGQCIPAANMGGDYYDFFVDEAGRLTLLIADVSGHNIGTALMMATVRSALRLEIALGKSLAAVLADTNRSMFADLAQAEMFVSVFCGHYDPATQTLTFANGGHNPPLLRRAGNEQVIELDTEGLLVGVLAEVTYEEKSIVLEPGDLLTLYTDGAVEARSPQGQQFGEDRFRRLLGKYSNLSPAEIAQQLYGRIDHHTEQTPQQDDITLLILKVLDEEVG